jgi:ATP-binding cassette, subfamily C (CFTR/MRP), member 1
MESSDACAEIDNTFRLYAAYCRGGFDFTLLFEESILSILPLLLLLIVTPFRILYLFRKQKKVVLSALLPFKLVRLARM